MEIIENESFSFDDSLIPVDIKVMHDGLNLNNSTFDEEAIELAKNSLRNKPILGYIKREDGNDAQDFAGHEVEIALTDDGVKYTYLERPLGLIPEQNNYSIMEEDGKKFVLCRGYLWKEYLNDGYAILKDNPKKSVSMEIAVDDFNYNEDGSIGITKYRYLGVTILGDDIPPAMTGAELNVVGMFSQDGKELGEKIEELNKQLALHYTNSEDAQEPVKGGEEMAKEEKNTSNVDEKELDEDLKEDEVKETEVKIEEDAEVTEEQVEDVEKNAQSDNVEPQVDVISEKGKIDEPTDVKSNVTEDGTDPDDEMKESEIDPDALGGDSKEEEEDEEVDSKEEEDSKDYKAEYSKLLKEFEELKAERDTLKIFKDEKDQEAFELEQEAIRTEKVDYINENYSHIDEEVKSMFISKVDDYDSIESIDADICVYIVKNKVVFSQAAKKEVGVKLGVVEEVNKVGSPYGGLFQKKSK